MPAKRAPHNRMLASVSGPDLWDRVAPRVDFDDWRREFSWRQGEHIGMIGPTGAGKTTLGLHLLEQRRYITAFVTKPRDPVMEALTKKGSGFRKIIKWKSYDPNIVPKRLLWPPAEDLYAERGQVKEFQFALRNIYREGGWTVFVDETFYVSNVLGMDAEIRTFLTQARSLDITMMLLTQRPSRVPLEIYDQSTHLFFWQENDERNLKTLGGISWANSALVQDLIAHLDRHECLYVNTRRGVASMVRFTAPERI